MKLSHCDAILSECCFQFICIYTSKSSGNVYFLRSEIPFSICNNKKMFAHTKKISVPFLCVIEFWWHSQSKKVLLCVSFIFSFERLCLQNICWVKFGGKCYFSYSLFIFSALTYKYFAMLKKFCFVLFMNGNGFHQYLISFLCFIKKISSPILWNVFITPLGTIIKIVKFQKNVIFKTCYVGTQFNRLQSTVNIVCSSKSHLNCYNTPNKEIMNTNISNNEILKKKLLTLIW